MDGAAGLSSPHSLQLKGHPCVAPVVFLPPPTHPAGTISERAAFSSAHTMQMVKPGAVWPAVLCIAKYNPLTLGSMTGPSECR